jgi:transposase
MTDSSIKIREKIVTLRQHTTKTVKEIAKISDVSISTVKRILKRYGETGQVGVLRKGNCGRKRITSKQTDDYLHGISDKNPRLTSFDISRELSQGGITIAPRTVRTRLLDRGRRARKPYKKQLLTVRMKKQRLEWARKYRSWTVEQWKQVLFSDETHFVVQGFRSSVVRRSTNEPLNTNHIDQAPKHPPKKMFWGSFSATGTATLIPVEGMMDSKKYREVVRNQVIPVLKERWDEGEGTFQQDKAPCHVSKVMMDFFKEMGIRVLEWPGNSPDLNPIENLWAILKKRIQKRDCSTTDKLVKAVNEIWFQDPEISAICAALVESMPKRIAHVIKSKGGHIMY